jgi:hypothetical protein
MNLWAEDLPAATRWCTELLGVEPYSTAEPPEDGSRLPTRIRCVWAARRFILESWAPPRR